MSSQFVTPSSHTNMQIKQEPVETEYQMTPPTPQSSSIPSPVPLPLMVKYGRMDATRSRSYDKQHSCCEVCQGEFSDQELLLQHKLLHFNTSHVCYICDCYFMNTSTLIMHIATNHRNLNPAMTGRNDPDRSFVCSICLQRFSSNKTLTRHQDTHKQQDESTFSCKICGLDFIGYRALVPHLNAARHKEMKIKIQSIFVCVDCRSVFPSRDSYAMHMMMRAQSETCSSKCSMPTSTAQIQKAYDYLPSANGWNGGIDTASGSQNSDSTRSDSAPLNLSLGQNRISPGSQGSLLKILTCCKCGETVPDEESLALHLMIHVREASDQSYFPRYSFPQTPKPCSPLTQCTQQQEPHVKRPDSAPVFDNIIPAADATVWTCHWCAKPFKTCDLLAMHMMDHQSQSEDKVNNNRKASPKVNGIANHSSKDGVCEAVDDNASSTKDNETKLDNTTDSPVSHGIVRKIEPGEICFSERSSPVCFKRPLSDADIDDVQHKRCKSVGSSILSCMFCDKHFLNDSEKNSHVVDDHGVSLKHLHCLVCNSMFSDTKSLNDHLEGIQHGELVKVKIAACQCCDFMASSEAQITQHEALHGIKRQIHFNKRQETEGLIADLLSAQVSGAVDNRTNITHEAPDDPGDISICPTLVIDDKVDGLDVDNEIKELSSQPDATTTANKSRTGNDFTQETIISSSKRSKRKSKLTAKFIPGIQSPAVSENETWMEETLNGGAHMYSPSTRQPRPPMMSHGMALPVAANMNMLASTHSTSMLWPGLESGKFKSPTRSALYPEGFQRPSTTTGTANVQSSNNDDESDVDLIDYVLSNADKLCMCKYCKIIYTDQTMYYLHMGLHNLNNPWQCNLCGKVSRNVHEFTSHVIHY